MLEIAEEPFILRNILRLDRRLLRSGHCVQADLKVLDDDTSSLGWFVCSCRLKTDLLMFRTGTVVGDEKVEAAGKA